MRMIIDISNDKLEGYAQMLKIFLSKDEQPADLDKVVAMAKETEEIVLDPSLLGDDAEKLLLGVACIALGQLGLEEKEEER